MMSLLGNPQAHPDSHLHLQLTKLGKNLKIFNFLEAKYIFTHMLVMYMMFDYALK